MLGWIPHTPGLRIVTLILCPPDGVTEVSAQGRMRWWGRDNNVRPTNSMGSQRLATFSMPSPGLYITHQSPQQQVHPPPPPFYRWTNQDSGRLIHLASDGARIPIKMIWDRLCMHTALYDPWAEV